MKNRRGFGLAQVILSAAAVAGLALVVSNLMKGVRTTGKSARLQGIAANLESQVRSSMQNTAALTLTRTNTPQMGTCLTNAETLVSRKLQGLPLGGYTGCTLTAELGASFVLAGATIPITPVGAAQSISDAGTICTPAATLPECQWLVRAWWRNLGGAEAETIQIRLTLDWVAPPGLPADLKFIMKTREIKLNVPRYLISPSAMPQTPEQMCLSLGGVWNGTATLKCTLVPPRAVMAFNLATCPPGWAALTAAQGRNIIGANGGLGGVGATGGSTTHTLSVQQMPSHTHIGSARDAGRHSHLADSHASSNRANYQDGGSNLAGYLYGHRATTDAGQHTHTLAIDPTGGGAAFPVMDPYLVLLYCYKL